MRKIINTNKHRLLFPKLDLSIESDEIKVVSSEYYRVLIQNLWIQEVIPEKEVILKKEKTKGRKRKITNKK